MAKDSQTNTNSGVKKIAPASVDLSRQNETPNNKQAEKSKPSQYLLLICVPVLFLAALAVIFVLPVLVKPTVVNDERSERTAVSKTTEGNTAASSSKPTGVSPWLKAQQTELRKDTQTVLAEMLDAQKSLMKKGVNVWAETKYTQAMQHAQAGDEYYGSQDFAAAIQAYKQANTIFNELLERVDVIFKETMVRGNEALLAGDSATAHEAFDLALVIDSIDRSALSGKERAGKVDHVFALLQQGNQLLKDDALLDAKSVFQQALEIDAESPAIATKITKIDQLLKDREFSQAMSAGFKQLQNNKLDQARKAFSHALRISPNSKEAKAALNQTRHGITSRNITALLSQAHAHEDREEWQQAMEKYKAALTLDANLANAQQGLNRTQTWISIHNKMDQILARPERLYHQDVFNETTVFLTSIDKVSHSGKKFSAKLTKLNRALARADKPILIQLQSDNKTHVTLYKVGELGLFTNKELVLRPGKYIAVGQRQGYRDVRVEFFVAPDKAVQTIQIMSGDKIALGK